MLTIFGMMVATSVREITTAPSSLLGMVVKELKHRSIALMTTRWLYTKAPFLASMDNIMIHDLSYGKETAMICNTKCKMLRFPKQLFLQFKIWVILIEAKHQTDGVHLLVEHNGLNCKFEIDTRMQFQSWTQLELF